MSSLFYTNNLDIGYQSNIISDINISVQENDMTAILCPNSCGKSTLIKTLCGIIVPRDGEIFLNGIKYSKKNFKKYMLNFGVVFEDFSDLFLTDKVIDELYFPLVHLEYKKNKIKERVNDVSNCLGIVSILDKPISNLSLYEKLLVSIAVSIVHVPKILFIDDVFKFIDNEEKKSLFTLLRHIMKTLNISILFTTSSINDIKDISYIYVIGDKKIKMEGNFKTIIKMDNELAKIGFDIPLMIDLSRKLEFYNLVDDIYYEPEKVVDKLWK